MRGRWQFLFISFGAVVLSTTLVGAAEAYCDPHYVNGNETIAPKAIAGAFVAKDWSSISSLLTDDAIMTVADNASKMAKGKANVVALLREVSAWGYDGEGDGYRFNLMKLSSNHWVTARLYPEFKQRLVDPKRPIYFPPHPIYYPFYSIAFLPDCEGRVSSIALVERSLIGD